MEEQARYHIETVDGHPFRMRYLPGGIFDMGSDEAGESPIHKVKLSAFFIGEYPVTQTLWKKVMGEGDNPSHFNGLNRPVERVSWVDIVSGNQGENRKPAFLKQLNILTAGTRPEGFAYRLPTEAEWEYAARGGVQVRMDVACGGEPFKYAGSDQLKEVGWGRQQSHEETKVVGLKAPNAFGLYDMSGNVDEWCLDTYSEHFYEECNRKGMVKDPLNTDRRFYVFRGGSFFNSRKSCEVTSRGYLGKEERAASLGFRLALAKVHINIL